MLYFALTFKKQTENDDAYIPETEFSTYLIAKNVNNILKCKDYFSCLFASNNTKEYPSKRKQQQCTESLERLSSSKY